MPYLNANSRALSSAERDALPSLPRATRTNDARPNWPRVDAHTRWASNSSQNHSDESSDPWGVETPLTAPFPARPYDTSVYIAPGPKSTPCPPTWVKPPTPPDSDKSSYTTISTSGSPPPPPPKFEINSLPTIPSGDKLDQQGRSRTQSSTRESQKQGTRFRRFKTALKEIFTPHPVDESQLEHISDRHWTDE